MSTELVLLTVGIVVLLLLRVPVAFAFLGPSLAYMWLTGQSVGLSLRLVVNATASFPLLAVPLFILLGVIANRAGIADRLFDFALALLGRVRGGLGYVSVGVSLGFSWMSGSAVADAAALGKIQIPAMLRNGYPLRFGLGVTGAASLIAPVMPPSIPAVIFAGLAAVSTGGLFAASVVPALLMALGLCVVVFVLVRRQRDIVPTEFSAHRLAVTGRRVIGPILAPVIILGGILGGFFTPTEAAAVGVAYMLVLGLAYRSLPLRALPAVVTEAVVTTGAIMLIVSSASLLGYILARERVPQLLAENVFGFTENGTVFLLMTAVLMLVLGTVVDPTAVLVLVVPILLPISATFGVDPIVLGVLMIVALMIGLLTPPVGTVLYVLSTVADTKVSNVFRGSLPFIVPLLVILGLIIAFPDAVLWLPEVLGL
ncbi:TRAP transporter large permease [Geodermatophilus sp. SYSU D00758]